MFFGPKWLSLEVLRGVLGVLREGSGTRFGLHPTPMIIAVGWWDGQPSDGARDGWCCVLVKAGEVAFEVGRGVLPLERCGGDVVTVDERCQVSASTSRLAKSQGDTTFRWTSEKKISSGSGDALPRPRPLRTGHARFRSTGSSKVPWPLRWPPRLQGKWSGCLWGARTRLLVLAWGFRRFVRIR